MSTQESIQHYNEFSVHDGYIETAASISDYLIKSATNRTINTTTSSASFSDETCENVSDDVKTFLIKTTNVCTTAPTNKRVQLSPPFTNNINNTTNNNVAKSINSYTKINDSMGHMTKGKSSLFKRLNFTSSDFFLYNNFIATYLRNRKNLDKLKTANNLNEQPSSQQQTTTTITPPPISIEPIHVGASAGDETTEEVVAINIEDSNQNQQQINDDEEYEDILDETTRILTRSESDVQKSRRVRSLRKLKLPRLIKKKNTTAPANIKLAPPPPPKPASQQFVLHNKPPIWNETSQVYQLDFGGRVTQESAKNFQIEYAGKQVMQFGRIDSNAYTLDFEWPFTTVQAFSIALANITQRLK